MKLNIDKLKEIYGTSLILEIKDNMDNVVKNLNYISSIGFKDPYDVIETNPYIFLELPELFQEKIESLSKKIGVDFIEKIEEDS